MLAIFRKSIWEMINKVITCCEGVLTHLKCTNAYAPVVTTTFLFPLKKSCPAAHDPLCACEQVGVIEVVKLREVELGLNMA